MNRNSGNTLPRVCKNLFIIVQKFFKFFQKKLMKCFSYTFLTLNIVKIITRLHSNRRLNLTQIEVGDAKITIIMKSALAVLMI